jgi:hypothetical protein
MLKLNETFTKFNIGFKKQKTQIEYVNTTERNAENYMIFEGEMVRMRTCLWFKKW